MIGKSFNKIFDELKKENKLTNKITYIKTDNESLKYDCLSFDKVLENGKNFILNGENKFKEIKIDPDEMHILLFTSGTTGKAKGICLSHKNICSNIMSIAKIVKIDTSLCVLSILPLHHTYECTIGHLLPLFRGGTISYCDGLKYINKNFMDYKPTFVIAVPLLLENIQNKIIKTLEKSLPKIDFSDVNFIKKINPLIRLIIKKKIKKSLGGKLNTFIVGAAAIKPETVEFFFNLGIRVLQGYGLTECSPLVAGNNDFYYKYDAVGLPIPEVEYKINNPDSQGNGEIIVKGNNVMLGYYKDIAETNNVIKDGWFYTGDLGYIDKNGYLYITGRCKNVIVTKNGKNIYPEEIEYHLNSNPFILESIVFGTNSNSKNESYVSAKVFPDLEAIKNSLNLKAKEILGEKKVYEKIKSIISNINSKLPNYKHIKKFEVLDEELEKTTTKKIKRFGKNLDM